MFASCIFICESFDETHWAKPKTSLYLKAGASAAWLSLLFPNVWQAITEHYSPRTGKPFPFVNEDLKLSPVCQRLVGLTWTSTVTDEKIHSLCTFSHLSWYKKLEYILIQFHLIEQYPVCRFSYSFFTAFSVSSTRFVANETFNSGLCLATFLWRPNLGY